MPAIRKDSAEISLAELVAQMPDGCRARRELRALVLAYKNDCYYDAIGGERRCCECGREYGVRHEPGCGRGSRLAAYKEAVK